MADSKDEKRATDYRDELSAGSAVGGQDRAGPEQTDPAQTAVAPEEADPSRRALLAGVAGMLAVAVAELVPREAQAQASGQTLQLETDNYTSLVTGIVQQPAVGTADPALRVATQQTPAAGLVAESELGPALVAASGPAAINVSATSTWTGGGNAGVAGMSDAGTGVRGVSGPAAMSTTTTSTMKAGVLGLSESGTGVIGLSGPKVVDTSLSPSLPFSAGVVGQSDAGLGLIGLSGPQALGSGTVTTTVPTQAGVAGHSELGSGVHGVSLDPNGAGVVAEHGGDGLALDVVGRTRLSSSGCGQLTIKSKQHQVNDTRIVAESVVVVTFLDKPSPGGLRVSYVELLPGTGFIIHLKGKPRTALPFAYLIIDRAGAC